MRGPLKYKSPSGSRGKGFWMVVGGPSSEGWTMKNNKPNQFDTVRNILTVTKLLLAILWLILRILEVFM
jgi:hypothetical protein